MAEAGRSLKRFYLALGAVAVVGIALIAHAATSRSAAPLVLADCSGPPLGGAKPAGQVLGPASAPVEITEYADFECPSCARFAILTMPDVEQRLIPTGKLRWRFMDFPLEQHANSPVAHVAAACAADQGKFWQMEYELYSHQNDWYADRDPTGKFLDYARGVGLDADSFRVCLTQRRHWPTIQANRCTGERLGIEGTPTLFVNGHELSYQPAYDDLVRIVDSVAALAAARRPSTTP
jgi:protein-disulfide isomerase